MTTPSNSDNEQREIERSLLPFLEACQREGYEVQCRLVPVPNPDHELFRNRPISFRLIAVEPEIRSRHYIDTWILFRRLLRETIDRNIRKRLRDFNIYPTLEASELPLPPIPHSETTELFNRLLYLMYWAFVDIRNSAFGDSFEESRQSVKIASRIADGLHNVPHDMFFWGYGNDGNDFSTFDFIYSEIERLDEENLRSDENEYCYRYIRFLEMNYESFVESTLRPYGGRQTGITFDPNRSQMKATISATTILYRPVGPKELDLIAQSDWRRFPPRLPEQPIFYPVLNEEYAREITKKWNVPESGVGFVLKFFVQNDYLAQFPVKVVGNQIHEELWIPSEQLEKFNDHIVGRIELVATYTTKKET